MSRFRTVTIVAVVVALGGCNLITDPECSCATPVAGVVVVGWVISDRGIPFASAVIDAQALDATCSSGVGGRYNGLIATDTNGAFEAWVTSDKEGTGCVRLTASAFIGEPVEMLTGEALQEGVRFRFPTATIRPDTVHLDVTVK